LLPFSPKPSVFPSVVKKCKNENIQDYILPLVLYGCDTWSLTLRKEHRLREFENKVLRRVLGRKKDGVTGGWRKLHSEELLDVNYSPSILRMIK
jgi:hypothetical protein